MHKEARLLRIGVLGAGPISQAGHFEACRKARNAELYAICDAAEDLLTTMAAGYDETASALRNGRQEELPSITPTAE